MNVLGFPRRLCVWFNALLKPEAPEDREIVNNGIARSLTGDPNAVGPRMRGLEKND